ncbi:DUF4181 domain-containing protein [Planococcus donghaensis]|uniref:DUF4181 domain-containing protein n=1 Tax=Planococcus donghaensis TaxID=414778 RepID=A0A1C7EEF0_9BACL|nr:DUF4181 domain-containing protein [Planococcus donghaensis]ANU22066.1 DUF4181 domain-containing protein [Planococcus donghaensis]
METVAWIGLLIIAIVYFLFANLYLKKKRGIKRDSKSIFHEDKNRYVIMLQGVIFVRFVYALLYIFVELDFTELSLATRISPLGLLILQTFVAGLEEWVLYRDKKRYWYEWSETIVVGLVLGLLFLTGG